MSPKMSSLSEKKWRTRKKGRFFEFVASLVVLILFYFDFSLGQDNAPLFSNFDLCHPSCDCLDTYFDCKRRGLEQFPDNFPSWVTKLNISNNHIRYIRSHSLRNLKNLQTLALDGNNITEIPRLGYSLPDLTYLSLSRNAIENVVTDEGYKNIRHLDLSRNNIQVIDNQAFPVNMSLRHLNLGNNQISILESDSLNNLHDLEHLNLMRNRINDIGNQLLNNLPQLEELDLSRNKLEKLESLRFQQLKRLETLNLRRNQMRNLSDAAFYGLDRILHMHLDYNKIEMVEKRWLYGLKSLRMLNLSRNDIGRIESESWEYVEDLQTLDLSHNRLESLDKGTVSHLTQLRFLNLAHNRIEAISPGCFLTLERLELLDLSNNELSWAIEDLPEPFRGLKSLTGLSLSSNRIQTLHPLVLTGLTSLKTLDLSNNPIKWMNSETFSILPHITLRMDQIDSLVCDCQAQWLHEKLSEEEDRIYGHHRRSHRRKSRNKEVRPKYPVCGFPFKFQNTQLTKIEYEDLICDEKQDRPKFNFEPKTQVFLKDGNGTLNCSASSFQEPPNIIWRRNHLQLPQPLESLVTRMESIDEETGLYTVNSSLSLVNVTFQEAGNYKCIASNRLGIMYSKGANVTVHVYPSFVKKPSNVTVRLGSNAKLECAADGFPPAEIAFQKDGGLDFPAALDRRFHVMPNDDSFFIMEVTLQDMGQYCCYARNDAGEVKACATVTVYETPRFLSPLEDESAVEGSNAILDCRGKGSPIPQISWNKDGIPISLHGPQVDPRYHLTENNSLLVIKNVRAEDAGRYECVLTNAVGTARDFSVLNVVSASAIKPLLSQLDTSGMTIIFIIIAVFCVVGTSAAWVVVIYRTRKSTRPIGTNNGPPPNSPIPMRGDTKFLDDVEDYTQDFSNSLGTVNTSIGGSTNITKLTRLETHQSTPSQSSASDKDSGTGEDLPPEFGENGSGTFAHTPLLRDDGGLSCSPRQLQASSTGFSTFGRTCGSRMSNRNNPHTVINMAHTPGRDFGHKKGPVPVAVPTVPTGNRVDVSKSIPHVKSPMLECSPAKSPEKMPLLIKAPSPTTAAIPPVNSKNEVLDSHGDSDLHGNRNKSTAEVSIEKSKGLSAVHSSHKLSTLPHRGELQKLNSPMGDNTSTQSSELGSNHGISEHSKSISSHINLLLERTSNKSPSSDFVISSENLDDLDNGSTAV